MYAIRGTNVNNNPYNIYERNIKEKSGRKEKEVEGARGDTDKIQL